MRHLLLVRHADYHENGDPDKQVLTKQGERQAEEVAQRLRALKVEWDSFISSPMPRAYQTAEIIARALGAKCVVDSRIYEIESWSDYQPELKNSRAFLTEFQAGRFGSRVLVILHGRRIRSFLDLAGVPLSEKLIVPFGNTSLTLLEYLPHQPASLAGIGEWQLSLLNDTAHLGGLKLWG